ncbi:hypothetical protein AAT19DRAFT_13746, partial [Rhodotorula toruloides]
ARAAAPLDRLVDGLAHGRPRPRVLTRLARWRVRVRCAPGPVDALFLLRHRPRLALRRPLALHHPRRCPCPAQPHSLVQHDPPRRTRRDRPHESSRLFLPQRGGTARRNLPLSTFPSDRRHPLCRRSLRLCARGGRARPFRRRRGRRRGGSRDARARRRLLGPEDGGCVVVPHALPAARGARARVDGRQRGGCHGLDGCGGGLGVRRVRVRSRDADLSAKWADTSNTATIHPADWPRQSRQSRT